MSSSLKVGKAMDETTAGPSNDADMGRGAKVGAKDLSKASSKRRGMGCVFRGKACNERLSLEESLKMVVTKSESPPSVLVNETSLALSLEYFSAIASLSRWDGG
ncbi:hypothetical protein SCHPADRAFT_937726 [Schizopora paradoxa]|uniref:Uncharacterized protein n=1 Tax=Schizopora paradoxa TaxID=27342 RepID=A0A0H2RX87_9AGAM|nr:hypothetical protein SCHPADRAFT_937726 [Schizopora paradoxa]